MTRSNDEFKYEIKENLAVLSTNKSGWTRELNLVSWNGGEPKYDLRDWNPDHTRMGKGISLTKEELDKLKEILDDPHTVGFEDDPDAV